VSDQATTTWHTHSLCRAQSPHAVGRYMVCTASTPPSTDSLGSCRVECRHLDKPTCCPSTKRVRKPFTRAEQHCVSFVIPTECTLCGQCLIRTLVLWTGTVGQKVDKHTVHRKHTTQPNARLQWCTKGSRGTHSRTRQSVCLSCTVVSRTNRGSWSDGPTSAGPAPSS
jgi:hypothetical protein